MEFSLKFLTSKVASGNLPLLSGNKLGKDAEPSAVNLLLDFVFFLWLESAYYKILSEISDEKNENSRKISVYLHFSIFSLKKIKLI